MIGALECMFGDDRTAAARKKKFSVEEFLTARPELDGFVTAAGIRVTFVDVEETTPGEIFSPHYDAVTRTVVLSYGMPCGAVRTAVEVHGAFQYCALMLDEREDNNPDYDRHLVLIRILCEVASGRYVSLVLKPGSEVEEFTAVAERLCRWDDPAPYINALTPVMPLMAPCCKILLPSDTVASFPSVPSVYGPMERLRQMLLRSAVDGTTPAVARRHRDGARKRLGKMYPEMDPLPEPFLRYFDSGTVGGACAWLTGTGEDVSVDLLSAMRVEAAVSDLELHHRRR